MAGLIVALSIAFVQFWPDWVAIGIVIARFCHRADIWKAISSRQNWWARLSACIRSGSCLLFFAFGSLFGFVGLLLAVPLAAAIGVVTRHALRAYMRSPLYGAVTDPAKTVAKAEPAVPAAHGVERAGQLTLAFPVQSVWARMIFWCRPAHEEYFTVVYRAVAGLD